MISTIKKQIKLLHLCVLSRLQLCNPMDCSPPGTPGSSVHRIFQGRILEQYLLFLIPRDLPSPRIEPTSLGSPAWAGRFFTTAASGKPKPNLRAKKSG